MMLFFMRALCSRKYIERSVFLPCKNVSVWTLLIKEILYTHA